MFMDRNPKMVSTRLASISIIILWFYWIPHTPRGNHGKRNARTRVEKFNICTYHQSPDVVAVLVGDYRYLLTQMVVSCNIIPMYFSPCVSPCKRLKRRIGGWQCKTWNTKFVCSIAWLSSLNKKHQKKKCDGEFWDTKKWNIALLLRGRRDARGQSKVCQ